MAYLDSDATQKAIVAFNQAHDKLAKAQEALSTAKAVTEGAARDFEQARGALQALLTKIGLAG